MAGTLGFASIAFLLLAVVSVPTMIFEGKKEKDRNKKIIEECDDKIRQIDRELEKINSSSAVTITEQE